MANPKKPMPEQVATRLANPLPQGAQQGAADRRTAALPQAPVPIAAPHARTMEWDPYGPGGPGRRAPIPTLMTMQAVSPSRNIGRWIGGPVLALGMAAATVFASNAISPPVAPPKHLGHLRVSSDPEGAQILVEGKPQPHPTPTIIDGEIGATLRISFRAQGYRDKEADVFVGEGERPFRAKLDKVGPEGELIEVPPMPEKVVEAPKPDPVPVPVKEEHVAPKKKDPPKHVTVAATPGATGTLSVHVRPWAIVYVDGTKIRQTPVDTQTFSAGMHVVELVNDELKKKEKVTIDIRSGRAEDIRRNWEK